MAARSGTPLGGRALSGHAGFGARLRTADTTDAVFGNALVNSRGSEIHLVIRTHGPTIPHMVDQQIHTFNGGCEDDEPNQGLCQDVQFAASPRTSNAKHSRAERGHTEGLLVGCLCWNGLVSNPSPYYCPALERGGHGDDEGC